MGTKHCEHMKLYQVTISNFTIHVVGKFFTLFPHTPIQGSWRNFLHYYFASILLHLLLIYEYICTQLSSLSKIGWFAIGLATRFLSWNDHLQFHCNWIYSHGTNVIGQDTWIATHANLVATMQKQLLLVWNCNVPNLQMATRWLLWNKY
jgi:hypothetical protein